MAYQKSPGLKRLKACLIIFWPCENIKWVALKGWFLPVTESES